MCGGIYLGKYSIFGMEKHIEKVNKNKSLGVCDIPQQFKSIDTQLFYS